MNSTVALSQIILRLTKISGVDTATARQFVRAFFGTIEEAIIHGETVTIKGIGTFRLVEGLESGQPPKVAFVPDEELAAQINAPFGMFEAVELADGVDFQDESDEAISTPESAPYVPSTSEPEPETKSLLEPEPPITSIVETEQQAAPEPEVTLPPAPEPVPETLSEPEPTFEADSESEAESQYEEEDKRSFLPWIIGGAVIVLGCVGGYLAAIYDDNDTTVEPIVEEAPIASSDTTLIVEDLAVEDLAQVVPDADPEPVAESSSVQTSASEPIYDTVSATNYLATMARKYYGKSGYWVFIYQANADKLNNPNRISPGTRVLIPDKASFTEATEEATTRKAEQLRRELNEKYGN